MIDTDKELLIQLSLSSTAAFDTLYRKYSGQVLAFAYHIAKNRDKAEDITHDIFLKIWEKREYMTSVSSFKHYLFMMTKNNIFNEIKHQTVQQKYCNSTEFINSLKEEHHGIEEIIDTKELSLLIDMTIENMPSERKNVFKLSREEGLSYSDIAQQLEISPKTVQYHISKALSELKKLVTIIAIFI